MKKQIIAMSVVLISWFHTFAQNAELSDYRAFADTFQTLYNKKYYPAIYKLTSPNFQSNISEDDFSDFIVKGVYYSMAEMESVVYLSGEKDYQSYLITFKNGKLQMDIQLDAAKKADYLRLLPHREAVKTKITSYNSDNKLQTALDSLVDRSVLSFMQSPQNCGLSIGISLMGTNYFYNYGETKRTNKLLADKTTLYEIGSITKTFCGLLLAMAVAEKKINLEDDIRIYLPGRYPNLPSGRSVIRIKHLANHTSGLPRIPANLLHSAGFDSLNPYKNYTRQMMLDYLKTIKIQSEPGTLCEYSNYGMALLGLILEDVYKKPFEELVKEKICLPNNMLNTTVNLSPEQSNHFSQGYNEAGEATPHWELNGHVAAGSLRSTTEDLLKYLDYNKKENDPSTKLAHTITFSDKQQMALAWFISKTKAGNTLTWHNGGTYGFASFCGFVKEKDCSVVILSNSATNVDYIAIALLNFLQR